MIIFEQTLLSRLALISGTIGEEEEEEEEVWCVEGALCRGDIQDDTWWEWFQVVKYLPKSRNRNLQTLAENLCQDRAHHPERHGNIILILINPSTSVSWWWWCW